MAEGSSAASTGMAKYITEREKAMKEVFSSALWHYTVHKYIGDIVQG